MEKHGETLPCRFRVIQRGVRLSTVGMSFGGKTMRNLQNHEEFKRAAAENMNIK